MPDGRRKVEALRRRRGRDEGSARGRDQDAVVCAAGSSGAGSRLGRLRSSPSVQSLASEPDLKGGRPPQLRRFRATPRASGRSRRPCSRHCGRCVKARGGAAASTNIGARRFMAPFLERTTRTGCAYVNSLVCHLDNARNNATGVRCRLQVRDRSAFFGPSSGYSRQLLSMIFRGVCNDQFGTMRRFGRADRQ